MPCWRRWSPRGPACASPAPGTVSSWRCAPSSASRSPSAPQPGWPRSEEHTSELQSLMRISYAVFCLKKKSKRENNNDKHKSQDQQATCNNLERRQNTGTVRKVTAQGKGVLH